MFSELMPIINQSENMSLSITPRENKELSIVMQSRLKPLPEGANDTSKQLHAALSMPLIVTASLQELEDNFVSMVAEYCQQHSQTQTALAASLERVKEGNKAARQTSSPVGKKAAQKPVEPVKEKATPPPEQSITQQTNPTSLF
jgi:PRTRC genetic system protein E